MRYVYFRRLTDDRRVKLGFIKLPYDNPYSAKAYLERRYNDYIISLYFLPSYLNSVLELLRDIFRRPIDTKGLAEFLHNLALMLRSGLPINDAMGELASDEPGSPICQLAEDLQTSLNDGKSLTE
ncbi:MAG: hypothetical protein RQ715_07040, partial [Methylococcales bacterium]|nr:hypothetical protein [Methylococcales bacterium]